MEKRVIRKPELLTRIPLSDVTIWRREKMGDFPKRIKLGGNSVGWFENEIDEWLSKKASERFESGAVGIRRVDPEGVEDR